MRRARDSRKCSSALGFRLDSSFFCGLAVGGEAGGAEVRGIRERREGRG